MRVATAVIYDSREDSFTSFGEDRVHELLDRLKAADLIVGFNIVDFDYHVLKGILPSGPGPQKVGLSVGSLETVRYASPQPLSPQDLNREKSADGLQSAVVQRGENGGGHRLL
jgi:DEAD/DEAH box helicase domain-containing protein